MIYKRIHLILILLLLLFLPSCENQSPSKSNRVIIGVASDVESLNPLYAFNVVSGSICEMMYLALVQHRWDENKGELTSEPMLAKSWEWSSDSSSLLVHLREDVYWSDNVKVTAEDVVFSFDIASDPDVQSRFYGTFNSFYTNKNLAIDVAKTFEIVSQNDLRINFLPGSEKSLLKIDITLLPKHIYEKINRKNFSTEAAAIKPVTNGAYNFSRWDKSQAIILKANKKSFLYKEDAVSEIIFKVIPDYTARLNQLKQGEIDLMEDIKSDDIKALKNKDHLAIAPIKGREYEYIGWNNIDPAAFEKSGQTKANVLFSRSTVRRALTMAINREEILEEYLFNEGEIANTSISPIFKEAFNNDLTPLRYDPSGAAEILELEGWKDSDNNGVLDKNGKEFRFTLTIPSGNPRRTFTATLIRNNLKAIGIDVNIESLEMSVFLDKMFGKNFDALLASWYIPIPIELKNFWYSKIDEVQFNTVSYQNKEVDLLLDELEKNISPRRKNELYKQFQNIVFNDQPVTFLYWVNNIGAYNKKIKGLKISPLGIVSRCWEWRIE